MALLRPFACTTPLLHMASSSSFSRLVRWLQQLARNPYFWSGIGGLFVIALGVYFLFNSVLMPSYTRHDASLQVPNVMDRSYTEAKQALERQGLVAERQTGRYNPRVPQDQVVDQNPPPASSVKPGRRVYLTVNSGTAPTVSVPDLTGTSLREARNRLTSLGLEVGSEAVDSIPSPYARTITRQRPAAGDSLKKGASVDIWYSQGLGEERVAVPNVKGLHVEMAERRLLQAKLRSVVIDARPREDDASDVDPTTEEEPDLPRWVRQQGLSPGTRVRSGTEVRLFVTPDSTAVPTPAPARSDSSTARPAPEAESEVGFSF